MKLLLLLLIGFLVLASAQVRLPEYIRRTLPNGLTLQLLEKRDVPMVTFAVTVRGGVETDPPGKAGLASLTAECLRRGTAKRTADQFSEQLDFMGASFSANVDEQSTFVAVEFLSKDIARALDLIADAVLSPTFPESEVKKLLQQRIDATRAAKDSPRGLTGRYFREFFYPAGHPYSHQASGDEISLEGITREDLVKYHERFYKAGNLIVTVAGDFDADAIADKIAARFGTLDAADRYEWVDEVPDLAAAKSRLLLVDKPGSTQTFFMIGQPGIYRAHPDRIPLLLINTLFGGRFTSLLNDALRVNAGLTYGVSSDVEQERLPGAMVISTFTATETTTQAIDLTLEVLKGFRENGIDAEQLDSAKAYVKGRFPTQSVETASQLAGVLSRLEVFGLGRDEVDRHFERIDAVTVEQANAVIRKHYRTENLQFVLVGDASKIKEQVSRYAPAMTVISVDKPGFRAD